MDDKTYQEIFNYLKNQTLPSELPKKYCKNFITKTSKYKLKNNILYRNKNNNLLRVIRRYELEPILYMMHDDPTSGHLGTEIVYNKIKERYYWPKMYNDIKVYIKSCDQCQRRKKPQGKNELHNIKIKRPFYFIGIDIVGPLPITERNKRYIVVAIDYFTKWTEARALERANANEVSTFILEEIICRHGMPKIILSDRGSHFDNQVISELMNRFKIQHRFSTPYHPKTNGLVERFNRTLCESLAKLSTERKNWDLYIQQTLFAHRSSKNSTTKIEPFYLTYGRKPTLPIDDEDHGNTTLNERINKIIEELPSIRNKTIEQVEKVQQKQKEYHDKKIKKKHTFEIGDEVLYYIAAKEKQWTGKLEEKWKGPYYIHNKSLKGSYKLKTKEGNVLRTPVNGELLKKYHSRQNFIPYLVI